MYTEIAIVHNTHNIVITGSKEVSSKEQLMQSTCQAGVRRVTGANNKHNSEYLRRRAKAQLRAEPPASHHRQPNNPHTHNINIPSGNQKYITPPEMSLLIHLILLWISVSFGFQFLVLNSDVAFSHTFHCIKFNQPITIYAGFDC